MTRVSLQRTADLAPVAGRSPAYRYHLLRAALDVGGPSLAAFDAHHLTRVGARADKSFELESLVLGTPEAAGVAIAAEGVEGAALVRILTEPRNALIRQYQRLFAFSPAAPSSHRKLIRH